jgi:predicted phage-related endonuclease
MRILNNVQGTTEWLAARLPRLTASDAKANITAGFKLSKSEAAMKAIDKMIAGIELAKVLLEESEMVDKMTDYELQKFMGNYTGDKFKGSVHTARGNDQEPDAIAALAERIEMRINDVGMAVMGDDPNGVVSCSPDGLIYDSSGNAIAGAEVKAPSLCNFKTMAINNVFPSEYKLQVHISMVVCNVRTWHFGAYFPGRKIFYKEVKWDNETDILQDSLLQFHDVYADRFAEDQAAMARLEDEATPKLEGII